MSEWKKVKLGEAINFRRGHDLPKYEMHEGNIPVAGSNGIIGYHNIATDISPCITIGRSGNLGKPFIYDKCWAHNTTLYIDDYKENYPIYIYYLLQTLNLSNYGGGSAVPTLNRNHIHPLEISLPPLSEQKKIASILGSLDDKIELNNRINKNLEEQASALFRRWFVDFEFPDPNNEGKPYRSSGGKFIESSLGEIPEGWEVGMLGDIGDITMGQSPAGESYNENGIGEVFYQGRAEFGYRFPKHRLFTTEPKRMADENSVLMSVRAPVGDINVAYEKCCIGRGLASIKPKNNKYSFVLYTMFSLKNKLDMFNGEGTVFGSINKDSLQNLKVIIPQKDSINLFEQIVSNLDSEIFNYYKEVESLSQLRDTLLPKLMNNEIKL